MQWRGTEDKRETDWKRGEGRQEVRRKACEREGERVRRDVHVGGYNELGVRGLREHAGTSAS
jgi:hypothetical protein